MAHARLRVSLAAALITCACAPLSTGCGDSASANGGARAPATASPSAPDPQAFPDEPHRLQHFHSKRFSLTIPLPDGKAWRIDDHTSDAFVATHAATNSTLTVSVLADPDELMTRQKCESLARQQKLVPAKAALRTVADERTYAMESFDTRVWVAIEPPATPAQPLAGYMQIFAGHGF